MARRDARERLLERALAHIEQRGISDLSLRELAAAIGTSHRMLIHHFGSREGLWVAVIRTVEQRQRDALAALLPTLGDDLGEAMRAWWRHLADPLLHPNERLFFELYGQALQGRPGTTELLDGIVDDWLEPAVSINVAHGLDPDAARAHARLGIAVTRGLLLDLLATGDVEGTTRAFDAWVALTVPALRAPRAEASD
ncbi:TetR/AcrR family transcriptional regulator [Conexibacter sp. JD483]|uniref:TetR/AcrR family transcriptional regulator n=1 Tax=unclassified Conexibacter TaxID=2627773 RepID=UPI0027198780|nr:MULTISPECIES: TetR/AcrR family transcriptional regulator [unclassified Conexibacter]MDO8185512.1 TetR/AcrR family transcriptional regulator [Conexibacter sp. CPCC 205706]MDO8197301.1 TetR/AcrR family transcriptional regulator [Conexibacter sp. CPCC 205762]MDR9370199.1 TetR/AcrR family transcriptional regulator [Conexibacter sp. JD483]